MKPDIFYLAFLIISWNYNRLLVSIMSDLRCGEISWLLEKKVGLIKIIHIKFIVIT